jgi:hypothetical protein
MLHTYHHPSSGAGKIYQRVPDVPNGLGLNPPQETQYIYIYIYIYIHVVSFIYIYIYVCLLTLEYFTLKTVIWIQLIKVCNVSLNLLRDYVTLRKASDFTKKQTPWSESASELYRPSAACRRSDCQLLRIKSATWSAWRIPTAVLSVF